MKRVILTNEVTTADMLDCALSLCGYRLHVFSIWFTTSNYIVERKASKMPTFDVKNVFPQTSRSFPGDRVSLLCRFALCGFKRYELKFGTVTEMWRCHTLESATQTRILEPIGHIWVIWSCTQTDRSAVVVNLLFERVQLHEKALKSSFVFLEGYIIWVSLISVWCTGILTWDTFLSHDSSKHRKIKLRRLSMWHFLKVILKEEWQPKIMNEHAIIDYANVITV